jgi:hypothetical protein
MNDIGSDVRAPDISSKTSKQPVGFGTDSVGASLVQKRLDGVRTKITMNLQEGYLQLYAESRDFVKLACGSDNALGKRIHIAASASIGTKRRVNDQRHINHVKGSAAFLKGAMVAIGSRMLGCIA